MCRKNDMHGRREARRVQYSAEPNLEKKTTVFVQVFFVVLKQRKWHKMVKKNDNSVQIWGLNLFSRSEKELLNAVESILSNSRKKAYIVTPNPEQIIQSRGNKQFLSDLQQADISIPDGVGLILASRVFALLGKLPKPLSERVAGVDVVERLLSMAQTENWKVLVLGGRSYEQASWQLDWVQSNKQSSSELPSKLADADLSTYVHVPTDVPTDAPTDVPIDAPIDKFHQLASSPQVWWLSGYQDVTRPSPQEEQRVLDAIKNLKPAVVFVAFGAPHQERWAASHLKTCFESGARVVMVVGGAFDFLLGKSQRPPSWVQQLGFEWLFRLLQEPWRWRRQLRLIRFAWLVTVQAMLTSSQKIQKG